ncbi:MAG: apolipoprotein N-acyltransferase [Bdellovibrionota bacterium]|jgi:apolipoprotein N-acyltransferase
MTDQIRAYIYAVLSAVCFGIGWWFPSTTLCTIFGWAAPFFFILLLSHNDSHNGKSAIYLPAYCSGILANLIGFYWLVGTIRDFGQYPTLAAVSIFLLYALTAAFQYLIVIFIYKNTPSILDKLALRGTLAWVVTEFISIRIFPWYLGHMQLAFKPLAQVAELGGAILISFIVFWCCEAAVKTSYKRSYTLLLPPLTLIAACIYGESRIAKFSEYNTPQQEVAVIQANITVEEKHNIRAFAENTNIYVDLTKQATEEKGKGNILVIWPETVIMNFIYNHLDNAKKDIRLPYYEDGNAMLTGSLTFDRTPNGTVQRFNSALAIYPDGTIPLPYNKRILMPFGEYIPFLKTFPQLAQFNPMAANAFDAGTTPKVFNYPMVDNNGDPYSLKVTPLICYEEILPSLSRESVLAGAELLVTLSNDAWFGKTLAPFQHHLIASFRAIENRRYQIRSTNSGLTAVINPLGETIEKLPIFSNGIIRTTITPLTEITVYTKLGDTPYLILTLLLLSTVVCSLFRKLRSHLVR